MDFTSDEKMPDSWPEFPGITKFAHAEPSADPQFESSDIALINSLSNLAPGALINELKAMHAIACNLAVEENHEKTRGIILRVLTA